MPYFHTKQFVTALSLMPHGGLGGGELEYSKCPIFKMKDTIDLKTCQQINFLHVGVFSHGGNKNLASLANFDFRIL